MLHFLLTLGYLQNKKGCTYNIYLHRFTRYFAITLVLLENTCFHKETYRFI